ncbi:MAG: type 1 glutamine amidotransferase [Pseudomonadota bacterium]
MRIAVYDCVTGDALTEKYGRTGPQVIDWIESYLPEASFSWVHIAGNAAPPTPAEVDGIIISGSEKGVYDNTEWMQPLRDNLQQMRTAGVAMFGICFGHQIMADVFGGKAEKSDQGFVTGSRRFNDRGTPTNAFLAHQDQVHEVPPGAQVIASAPHCPVAALAYDFPALSVQFHPEYNRQFATDLIDMFGAELMPDDQLQAARDSLSADVADDLWCKDVAEFFREHCNTTR